MKDPVAFLALIVTLSLAEAVKKYASLSPAVLIEPDKVCPQEIGVWASAIKGRNVIVPKIRITRINGDLDFDVIS
jgi:hypothetical protein